MLFLKLSSVILVDFSTSRTFDTPAPPVPSLSLPAVSPPIRQRRVSTSPTSVRFVSTVVTAPRHFFGHVQVLHDRLSPLNWRLCVCRVIPQPFYVLYSIRYLKSSPIHCYSLLKSVHADRTLN